MELAVTLLLFIALGLIFILVRIIVLQDEDNEHLKSVEHFFDVMWAYEILERRILQKNNIIKQEDRDYEGE